MVLMVMSLDHRLFGDCNDRVPTTSSLQRGHFRPGWCKAEGKRRLRYRYAPTLARYWRLIRALYF